ncbi:hypothetical protein BG015_007584 [Linnemannia schmuckeri]|uniref:Uncharacterized protein n=1 Tax=Linnemannia schmuckeri TaxID=64567 RepID=A0A9P5S8R7_9FUNG|nr:hypothetical protein BG015_007584 [Linnemannia schmuckeri]
MLSTIKNLEQRLVCLKDNATNYIAAATTNDNNNSQQGLTVPKIPFRDLKEGSALVLIVTTLCPALTTINFGENLIAEEHMFRIFVVASAPDKLRPFSNIGLDDLLGADWVCLGLETLSISINELAVVMADEAGVLYDGPTPLALEDKGSEKDNQLELAAAQTDEDYARYSSMVLNVSEFYRGLKALPEVATLDLQWSKTCQTVPYECGMAFSDDLLTVDNLQWMGLSWSTRSSFLTTAGVDVPFRERSLWKTQRR